MPNMASEVQVDILTMPWVSLCVCFGACIMLSEVSCLHMLETAKTRPLAQPTGDWTPICVNVTEYALVAPHASTCCAFGEPMFYKLEVVDKGCTCGPLAAGQQKVCCVQLNSERHVSLERREQNTNRSCSRPQATIGFLQNLRLPNHMLHVASLDWHSFWL